MLTTSSPDEIDTLPGCRSAAPGACLRAALRVRWWLQCRQIPAKGAMSEPIEFTTVSTAADVGEILALQAANLPSALTPDTMTSQGFVTVRHDRAVLQRMNEAVPSIIARAANRVVGYALVMPCSFAAEVPELYPMFEMLDTLSWNGVSLRHNARWFVMGQICIDEGFRGIGIFDGLYRTMSERYRERYDFTVTEVAARNTRSMRAHERVGFRTLRVYPDPTTGEEWHVIALDLAECLASFRAASKD
jgi:ribosomal protein S18 acetylase RimI-like enzyme